MEEKINYDHKKNKLRGGNIMANLKESHQRFVDEYLIDLNATQAAIRAGYSSTTANVQGTQLLANPKIRAAVDQAIAQRSKRTGVSQDRIIAELAKVAFVNVADFMDLETGKVKKDATPEDTAAISNVKVKIIPTKDGKGLEREIGLASKLKALELLGKHLGMFVDKSQLDIDTSLKIEIEGEYDEC